jgi:hypothetical protein
MHEALIFTQLFFSEEIKTSVAKLRQCLVIIKMERIITDSNDGVRVCMPFSPGCIPDLIFYLLSISDAYLVAGQYHLYLNMMKCACLLSLI